MSTGKTPYSAPALEKGLDILEYLARSTVPQTQADLMRSLGRTQSEIYRMLSSLVHRGYVQRDENSGAYRLTLKLYALSHQQSRTTMVRRAAGIPMEELAESTGQACHLSLLQQGALLVVMERLPARRVCLAVGEGSTISLSQSASGFVLLNALPDREWRLQTLKRDARFSHMGSRERSAFLADIEAWDRRGTYMMPSPITPGGLDFAVCIGTAGTDTFGTLAISYVEGDPDEATRTQRKTAVWRCAQAINRNLGLEG